MAESGDLQALSFIVTGASDGALWIDPALAA
jgi:hypothetical protein